jgi:hypothetical protein
MEAGVEVNLVDRSNTLEVIVPLVEKDHRQGMLPVAPAAYCCGILIRLGNCRDTHAAADGQTSPC